MIKTEIDIHNEIAHYFTMNSNGEEAHFYPGNGLPVGVYQPFQLVMHPCRNNISSKKNKKDLFTKIFFVVSSHQ